MPVYEYECTNGHRHEVIHGIEAPGPEQCPVCGAPLHKLLSHPAIVFKGSGWAKKDRRTAARSASTEGTSGATDGAGDSGAEPKTPAETAPATRSTEGAPVPAAEAPSTGATPRQDAPDRGVRRGTRHGDEGSRAAGSGRSKPTPPPDRP